jgi:hypothetical protein
MNKTLTSIDLGYNGIGKEGMKSIVEALKMNKTIPSINVTYNANSNSTEIQEEIDKLIERNR